MVKNNALTVGCFLREPTPAHGSGTAAFSEYLVCEVGARGERVFGQGQCDSSDEPAGGAFDF